MLSSCNTEHTLHHHPLHCQHQSPLVHSPTHGRAHGTKRHKEGTELGAEYKIGSGATRYINIPNSRGHSICPQRSNCGCLVGPDCLFSALCACCVRCSPQALLAPSPNVTQLFNGMSNNHQQNVVSVTYSQQHTRLVSGADRGEAFCCIAQNTGSSRQQATGLRLGQWLTGVDESRLCELGTSKEKEQSADRAWQKKEVQRAWISRRREVEQSSKSSIKGPQVPG